MEPFEEIRNALAAIQAEQREQKGALEEQKHAIAALQADVRSQRETLQVLADNVVAVNRSIEVMATAQVDIGRSIAAQMMVFEQRLSDFNERFSVMLAQAAQARTQDLERWLRIESRLR